MPCALNRPFGARSCVALFGPVSRRGLSPVVAWIVLSVMLAQPLGRSMAAAVLGRTGHRGPC